MLYQPAADNNKPCERRMDLNPRMIDFVRKEDGESSFCNCRCASALSGLCAPRYFGHSSVPVTSTRVWHFPPSLLTNVAGPVGMFTSFVSHSLSLPSSVVLECQTARSVGLRISLPSLHLITMTEDSTNGAKVRLVRDLHDTRIPWNGTEQKQNRVRLISTPADRSVGWCLLAGFSIVPWVVAVHASLVSQSVACCSTVVCLARHPRGSSNTATGRCPPRYYCCLPRHFRR